MESSPNVCSVVWNLIRGGTEGQCARVAMACAAPGQTHRVAVFRREGFFLEQVENACGPVYHLDVRRFVGPATKAAVAAFAEWLQREDIDVVHTWDMDANIFATRAARQAGIPCITSRRDLGQIYPWYKLWLQRRAEKGAKVVVNARRIAEWAAADGVPADSIYRLPNVLDVEEFDALVSAPTTLPERTGEVQLIQVARLDREKNTGQLIDVLALLAGEGVRPGLWIVGDGPERDGLELRVEEWGLSEQVSFLGERHDIPALLKAADIGVLVPRANEGLSNTLLEYLAAGLPVLVSDCGGNAELVEDGVNGQVVSAEDDPSLWRALDEMLKLPEDERRKMGRRGRVRVEQEFTPEVVIPQFQQLYREAAQ